MTKYIIKNCPCYDGYNTLYDCYDESTENEWCKNNDDCLLKQIVKICSVYRNIKGVQLIDFAKKEVALKILDKLEIEEINE